MKRGLLIVNRTAGQRSLDRVLVDLSALFAREGLSVESVATAAPGDATRLAREAATGGGADVVFVLGGDGTLREAAQGLVGTGVPLAALPGGTANVLALALGLPRDPVAAAALQCRSRPRPIDAGLVGGHVFLMMVSAGLDARVLASLDPLVKRRWGRGHVLARGFAEWWRYAYPALAVEAGGAVERASLAVVSNIPFYGGRMRLAPAARLDDRRLDLLLFRGAGRRATLAFAWGLLRARHLGRADVVARTLAPGESVTLLGPPDAAVQVDGDPWPARPPLEIGLAPEPLAVLAPAPP